MKGFYDLWYRYGTPPWVGAARAELVALVTDGSLVPGRAIDLGCGVGDNAIFLARHGFTVTGVDFAPAAIERARRSAETAGVDVQFAVDDLTQLRHVRGPFDLLLDYGTLDDLDDRDRDAYVRQVLPLTHEGTRFLLWCFEWQLSRWERFVERLMPFGKLALAPGEAQARFGRHFTVDRVDGGSGLRGWPRGWAAYLMVRNGEPS